MATDGGNRGNANEMPLPSMGKVLHRERCHRGETYDIHGDCVGLGVPFQGRILAPCACGDDEHIKPPHLCNQIARSRACFGDIVQIEPHRRRDSRMLRREFAESFNTSCCDPDGISASRKLHGDGGTYA